MSKQAERAAAPVRGARRVVVGVSGSIAAYKSPQVVRLLREAGHEVKVVPTAAALRFIGESALAAVSGGVVHTGVFDDPAGVEHVATGEWAELVLVAPASANLLARVTAGRSDDLLTATILTTTSPVVLAPAMHTQMWENAATQENVATLRRRGITVIEPAVGRLTGKDSGKGRFPEPELVVAQALEALATAEAQQVAEPTEDGGLPALQGGAQAGSSAVPNDSLQPGPLTGRHVVVSAGGTREPLDPVRYLGNRSSGRQGVALAVAAAKQGAQVTLAAANISADVLAMIPEGLADTVHVRHVSTAEELRAAVREAGASADVIIMAAAVADFRPARVAESKIKKYTLAGESLDLVGEEVRLAGAKHLGRTGEAQLGFTLELVPNPDILAELVTDPPRSEGRTLVVGFAAETGDEEGDALAHGIAKARRKGADLLVINAVGAELGFGDVPNAVVVVNAEGEEQLRTEGSKVEVAEALIGLITQRLD